MQWYTKWDLHGEKDMPRVEVGMSSGCNDDDDMNDAHSMLRDFAYANRYFENFEEEPNADAKEFYNMVNLSLIHI